MKLPNGYGNVSKLPGNRRKPWRARKTVKLECIEGNLKQTFETIGYYPTKAQALQALAEFNDDPYDLIAAKKTFIEVYEKWKAIKFQRLSAESQRNYDNFIKHCKPVHDTPISKLKLKPMQDTLDKLSSPSARRVRIIYKQVFQYAIEREWITKDYSKYLKLPAENKKVSSKSPFTIDEIKKLWEHVDTYENKIAIILIYTGLRISELLNLKRSDVHLDEQYFDVIDSKTQAGIRMVPIADATVSLWKYFLDLGNDYAIPSPSGKYLEYSNFSHNYWVQVNACLGTNHTIHETRHTCISLLTMADVNHTIIKKIVGHKTTMDLTESTYTHIYINNLKQAINKIVI